MPKTRNKENRGLPARWRLKHGAYYYRVPAESLALREITKKIAIQGHSILAPAYADMQPRATYDQIAKSAQSKVDFLHSRGADRVIVLIDFEDNDACPGCFAADLSNGFSRIGLNVEVVVKVRSFENWLIADPGAFAQMKARFQVSKRFVKAVSPNKADSHDADGSRRLINSICKKSEYHKRKDAISVAQKLDIDTVGQNSRSFRRLLRVIGHEDYLHQSRTPA